MADKTDGQKKAKKFADAIFGGMIRKGANDIYDREDQIEAQVNDTDDSLTIRKKKAPKK